MKKIAVLLTALFCVTACKKDSEQVKVAKEDLKINWGKSDEEISDYDFDVAETPDRDVYDLLQRIHTQAARESRAAGAEDVAAAQLKLAAQFLDSVSTSKGDKIFYNVHFYRTKGRDTIANGHLLLNDQNQKIGFRNLK